MVHRAYGPRLLVGFLLMVGLLAATAARAGAQEIGTVSVYVTECPAGYDGDDLFGDCYGNPVSGQSFSAQQGKSDQAPAVAASDAAGFATLPLYGGTTTISEGLPQGVAEYFVFCTGEDGSAVAFDFTGDTFGIFLEQEGGDYEDGEDLRCDWYNVPAGGGGDGAPGTLTIFRYACPAGYQGDDYYDDCAGNPIAGADFGIRRQGTDSIAGFSTGPDGGALAYLSLTFPATVVVSESTGITDDGEPIPYLDYVVFCTRNGGEAVPVDYGQSGVMDIVFDAAPDDAVACDWFYVPRAGFDTADQPTGEGTLTLYVTACPAGYDGDDYFADCYDDPVTGQSFAVSDAKSDFRAQSTTGANGFASLPIPDELAAGTLTLSRVPVSEVPAGADPPFVVYCTASGGEDVVEVRYSLVQLDPGGDAYTADLTVPPGDEVRCDWYVLTAADQDDVDDSSGDSVADVTTLPSTGTGAATAYRPGDTIALLVLGGIGAVALIAGRQIGAPAAGVVRRRRCA